jgi:hypothetical protein
MICLLPVSAVVGLSHLGRIAAGSSLFTPAVARFGSASFTLSLVVNVTVTALLAGRLVYHARKTSDIIPKRHIRQYMKLAAIFVDSGAIYALFQIAFVVIYNMHSNIHLVLAFPAAQIYVSHDPLASFGLIRFFS